MDIYREEILDHFKNPRNFGSLTGADFKAQERNASCGDVMAMAVKVKGGKIEAIKFQAEGCAISIASASMLTEMVKGESVQAVTKMSDKDMLERLGIEISLGRITCASLGLVTLKKALTCGRRAGK